MHLALQDYQVGLVRPLHKASLFCNVCVAVIKNDHYHTVLRNNEHIFLSSMILMEAAYGAVSTAIAICSLGASIKDVPLFCQRSIRIHRSGVWCFVVLFFQSLPKGAILLKIDYFLSIAPLLLLYNFPHDYLLAYGKTTICLSTQVQCI